MEISKKYLIFNYLDELEEMDYLFQVSSVAKEFNMSSLDDAEWFVRGWYKDDSSYIFYYELLKKISETYGKSLTLYQRSLDFWNDVIEVLDIKTLELLLFISDNHWLGEAKELIKRKRLALIN